MKSYEINEEIKREIFQSSQVAPKRIYETHICETIKWRCLSSTTLSRRRDYFVAQDARDCCYPRRLFMTHYFSLIRVMIIILRERRCFVTHKDVNKGVYVRARAAASFFSHANSFLVCDNGP